MRSRARYALLTAAYAVMVFLLSSRPGNPDGPTGPTRRVLELLANLAHVPLFAGLTWAGVMIATGGRWSRPLSPRAYVVVGSVATVFAILDEWHQSFVPDRFAGVGDVVLDCIGIASVIMLHAYGTRARMARSA